MGGVGKSLPCQRGSTMQTELGALESLAEKYRPVRIADFIGWTVPRKCIIRVLQAAHVGRRALCRAVPGRQEHMALALAEELQAEKCTRFPARGKRADDRGHCSPLLCYAPMTPGGSMCDGGRSRPNDERGTTCSALENWITPTQHPTRLDIHRERYRTLGRVGSLPNLQRLEFFQLRIGRSGLHYLDKVWPRRRGNGNAPDWCGLAKD